MDWIKWLLGQILNGIFIFLDNFNMAYLAVCIVIFTVLIRALMIPFTLKQQRFSKLSSVMQPEIKAIQDKYRNKNDQESMVKMNREITNVYQKYGTSPTGGCLSSLITLPIMLALYNIIYDIPSYIPTIGAIYNDIAEAISNSGVEGYAESIASYVKELNDSRIVYDPESGLDGLINVLKNFKTQNWVDIAEIFKSNKECYSLINEGSQEIIHYSRFFGELNIMDYPTDKKWPGLLIPIFAVLTQWYSMRQIQAKTDDISDNPTAQSMQMMTKIMPFFSGFICLAMPIGVGIYWITGSLFIIVQQFFVKRYMDNIDMDELVKNNMAKAKKTDEHKKQAGLWEKILQAGVEAEGQNANSKTIKDYARVSYKNLDDKSTSSTEKTDSSSVTSNSENKNLKISDYAKIMNSKK